VTSGTLLLGVDGGGTHCRGRLSTATGQMLAEALGGPANIRLGLEKSVAVVLQIARECLARAGLKSSEISKINACLALAGASELSELESTALLKVPFRRVILTSDARAACLGAHPGRAGAVIVVGTGSVAWAELEGRSLRIGGWGLPLSDEGSGAWIGCEALRRTLWAQDGWIPWTPLLRMIFDQFQNTPHKIVRFASEAAPRDFGALAPQIVGFSESGDQTAVAIMQTAAAHIDRLSQRLLDLEVHRQALVGGLAARLRPWLSTSTRSRLVEPTGDAVDGALQIARSNADAVAA
jgi:glucosamine kinase